MEYFKFYLDAFKKFNDYRNPAPRKEFNFYILFFFIFWVIVFIPLAIYNSIFILTGGNTSGNLIVSSVVSWVYFGLHLPSMLALVKRRLIDINPSKANLLFRIFLIIQAIIIVISVMYTIEASAIQNTHMSESGIDFSKMAFWMFLSLLNIIASVTIIVIYVYLMTKQKDVKYIS